MAIGIMQNENIWNICDIFCYLSLHTLYYICHDLLKSGIRYGIINCSVLKIFRF